MTEMAPEELYPPRPGGMVDTARKQAAAEQDQLARYETAGAAGEDAAGQPYPAIRVRPEAADTGTARTITLSPTYQTARLLPADPQRRMAVIIAVDNDVYITQSEGLAHDVAGNANGMQAAYLPAGIGIPISDQGQYFVAATTAATSSRVSVFISRDTKP